MTELYSSKKNAYFGRIREDLIALFPHPVRRVLEIGCGTGKTLLAVRERGLGEEVWGIDLHPFERQQELDRFVLGDIEEMDLSELQCTFDVVLAGDILEHLKDPWQTLKQLKQVMHPDAYLLVCIPNLRDITVLGQLILWGDFRYREEGTMDRAHLRFFTKKSLVRLLQDSGYRVRWARGRVRGKRRFLNWLTLGLFSGFLERQCYAVAQPGGGANEPDNN